MTDEINYNVQTALVEPSSSSTKVVYKIDIDYEAKLFQPDYQEKNTAKIIKEWEYVYFLIQQNPFSVLKTFRSMTQLISRGLEVWAFASGTSTH